MQPLLDALRKASLPAIWSQGVKLAREKAVTRAAGASSSATELTLRVRAPGHAIAPTVTLYPADLEWSCDCGGKVDPCAHAAAAAIAAAAGDLDAPVGSADRANDAGEAAAPVARARLVARLGRKGRLLTLERIVVHGDGKEEKLASLTAGLAKARLPAGLEPTHDDLLLDRILGAPAREVVPLARVGDVLGALASSEVTFEGAKVQTSGELLMPRAIVEDGANGKIVLRLERDPAITDVIALGVARCGATLRPLGDMQTTGEMLERLPLARAFDRAQQAELVTRVLPELEKRLEITVTTKRLPRRQTEARPRIAMDLSHQGHTLSVLPTLVYGDPPIARVDGDALVPLGAGVPVRRTDEEKALLQRLRDDMNLVPGRRVDLDGHEAIRFAAKLRAWQEKTGDTNGARVFDGKPLAAHVVFEGDAFDLVFEHEDGEAGEDGAPKKRTAQAATVIRAWRDGLDLVPLDGGGWAPLPAAFLATHGHRVADLLAARDEEKRLPRASLPELGALCAALDAPMPPDLDKLAPLAQGFTGIPHASLPAGFNATLRHYQEQGHDWIAFLRDAELGGVLADDMGLGKTVQTIAALQGRVLVVCPRSVVYNWADEIARFRPGLRAAIYEGPRRSLDRDADVTLTTYAILRLDAEELAAEEWDAVVLDEAQAIKNETSQTARAAFGLQAKLRLALSGTPIENRLEELWSVMHFANPGLLGGRSDFQERYVSPVSNGDGSAMARLRAKIRPFVLRRMKREVLPELPPRTDSVLHVELDETERAVYDAVRAATKKDVVSRLAEGGNVLAVLEALLRLRQAACHAALVPGQRADTSSKVERLVEALVETSADGHKALVFSQWTGLLDRVEPALTAAGIGFARLDGSTRDRAGVVARFQDDAGPPVMLVSLKAGGTGLNLTAADHVFLLDPWWNPAVEDQAADRAHRIGQERPVMVYRMVAKDTVEERIFALQEKKRRLADAALSGADHAGGITREDLLALLD